jgi:O-acetyl-ADP-ribose deacetylase (regulator of RNase III)
LHSDGEGLLCGSSLRFPPDRAARIAVGTVLSELASSPRGIARVVFCCFAPEAATHHIAALSDLGVA